MKFPFTSARLFYGTSVHPVIADAVFPFGEFDTDGDIDDQVYRAMALMSNASGGHLMHSAELTIGSQHVSLRGAGFTVMWGSLPRMEGISIEEYAALHTKYFKECKKTPIEYQVRSDQYGEGWKRALKYSRTGELLMTTTPEWHSGNRPIRM